VEGVKGEETSYLWYIKSLTCSLSMYDKVPRVVNCVNCVADSDITIAALIEVIHRLTTYRVRYGKAWRAKEHAFTLLWGDLREADAKVPRLLYVISHFNPDTRCIIDTCCQWLPNETYRYYSVLKRIFWCFP
jgi:hypothetical protein